MASARPILIDEFVFSPHEEAKASAAPGTPGPKRAGAHKRFIAGGLALLLVAVGALFFVLRGGEKVAAAVYTYAFQPGDVRNYEMVAKISMKSSGGPAATEPFEGEMRGRFGFKVIAKMEDGSGIVEMSMSDIRFEPASFPFPTDAGTVRLGIAPDGRIKSVNGTGGLMGAMGGVMQPSSGDTGNPSDTMGNQFLFPQFPAEAVASGDEWETRTEETFPGTDQKIVITTKGRLGGGESTDYGDAVKVIHEIDMPMDVTMSFADVFNELGSQFGGAPAPPPDAAGAAMSMKGAFNVDSESLVLRGTNDLVKMTGVMDMDMTMSLMGMTIAIDGKIDMVIDRVG
jgi:hypothetical protein